MKPTKLKTADLLYPITNELGEENFVSYKDYLSIRSAQLDKLYPDAQMTAGGVGSLLEVAVRGQELQPDAPKGLQRSFDMVKFDYECAVEHSKGSAAVEVVPEVISVEAELVERAVGDFIIAKSLSDFHQKFDLGPNMLSCSPKQDASDGELIDALAFQLMNNTASEWAVGRLVNLLNERGQENVIIQICSQLNRSYQLISKWSRTEKAIPVEYRSPKLALSTYCEIGTARFDKNPEVQAQKIKELCESALSEGWGVAEARSAVKAAQGKSEAPTPPPVAPKHGRYIVIDQMNCPMSFSTDQLPDVTNGFFIIDSESGELACGSCGSGIPAWQPLRYVRLEAITDVVEMEL